MIDLYTLCADLSRRKSAFRTHSNAVIADIYAALGAPSEQTRSLAAGWREDFRFIYGGLSPGLSGNRRLDMETLFHAYGIPGPAPETGAKALQTLFFAVQTYFSLLVKYIMADILREIRHGGGFSREELILGEFARQCGIENYCQEDWYCWPVFELDRGFRPIMDEIGAGVGRYHSPGSRLLPRGSYDFIKQIYQALIPKELRHALGEYYTPDWLAEAVLHSAVEAAGPGGPGGLSILDPTCGSGTFLVRALALKRRDGCPLPELLSTVRGIDINPLAVLTAKTNYILSILDLLGGAEAVTIPVYNADLLSLPSAAQPPDPAVPSSGSPAAAVRSRLLRDAGQVRALPQSDLVVGNPPWVNWEYLPAEYRQSSRHLWRDYQLFDAAGRERSFSKEDISVLVTCIAMDRLLKDGGVLGFVIRQGVFKSARNGAGFRRFLLRGRTPVRALRVDDLSALRVFDGASIPTALFFAKKGEPTSYPVPYGLWEKGPGAPRHAFGPYSRLGEVMEHITVREQYAVPAVDGQPDAPWMTAGRDALPALGQALGANGYRARTGVFTGGANAVYRLRIHAVTGGGVRVSNIMDRARRRPDPVTAELEPDFIYPMLKGGNVGRWNTCYDSYLLCPHTAETRMWPVPQEQLAACAPKTMDYLTQFREFLDGRSGFAGWEQKIQRKQFHAILRVGDYTFSKYKVVWRYIASEFICAVVSTVADPFLGEKLLLPNEKVMYVATDDETEAYYLCGVLSTTLISQCVKGYMNPTSISAHVLDKLRIPQYDPQNPLHLEIAGLCRQGHGQPDLSPFLREIDRLAPALYGPGAAAPPPR